MHGETVKLNYLYYNASLYNCWTCYLLVCT